MSKRASALLVGLIVLLGILVFPGALRAERCPCGHLLLPYFEVQLTEPTEPHALDQRTTTFAVGNHQDSAIRMAIEVRTNWGIPVLTLKQDLGAKSMFTVNLRDWLVLGQLPDRQLSPEELAHVQAALSGAPSPKDGLYYSTAVGEQMAVGYVLFTALTLPSVAEPDYLWGDFFTFDRMANDAKGESLVRLVGGPTREVCEHHMIRFLEGGPFDAGTEWVFWTGLAGSPSRSPLPGFDLEEARCTAYDEAGVQIAEEVIPLLATQAIAVGSLGWTEPFGWVDCTTNVLSFVCAAHNAFARDGLVLRSFCEPPEEGGDGFVARPRVAIEKSIDGDEADTPPGPSVPAGSMVTWTYEVRNTGNVPLTNVTVVDDQGVAVTCPETTLAPSESMLCTGSGIVPAGDYANVGTVTGLAPSGLAVEDSDPCHCHGSEAEEPEVDIEKATNGQDADLPPGPSILVGDPVAWTYEVTNTGNVPLTDLVVTDDHGVAVTCPKTALDPGESMTCTANGVAELGSYVNLGWVEGDAPDGTAVTDSDVSHYLGTEAPVASLDIEKATNGQDADLPPGPSILVGDPVTWTYEVTNTGSLALAGVVVTDDQGVAVTCPKTVLAPGESMTCTAQGTATSGQYANLGSATGQVPGGPSVGDDDPSHYFGVTEEGDEGCTPGYWKNHTDSWSPTGYAPDQAVASVFAAVAAYPDLASATLLEALGFGGGPGAEGAAAILLRAGVAALLNAAHSDVAYPLMPAEVIGQVDAALASGDRDAMLTLATQLDADNNLGCPLS